MTKGAWAALFGGPGYLLLAVMLGWVVPGWAAFMAVAAFVGTTRLIVNLVLHGAGSAAGPTLLPD